LAVAPYAQVSNHAGCYVRQPTEIKQHHNETKVPTSADIAPYSFPFPFFILLREVGHSMTFPVGVYHDVVAGIGRVVGIQRQASLYLQNSFAVLVNNGVDERPQNRHKDHWQQEIHNVYHNIVLSHSHKVTKAVFNRTVRCRLPPHNGKASPDDSIYP